MLRIAIQTKGRLHEESMDLLASVGIKLTSGKRKLLTPAKNFPCEVLFLRDDDIPEAVADGVADIGIVGENEYLEKQKNAGIEKRLGYSKCRMSLAIPKGEVYKDIKWFDGKKVATSYPVILKKYLTENGVNADIHEISGSVEVAPGIGLADGIFDIVSSGSTLISNGLKEVCVALDSEALLIKAPVLSEEKQTILDELLFRIDAALECAGKKYIMLNAPTDKVEKITDILPGIKSPTVLPLAEEGWTSIHSVIEEKVFWSIVGDLKANGAEGILVLPIEKMVL
ncbi:MAG: ATP phosphoribosyltransferase [Bacteroidales bacterium]|jgi:ATP phosphoribosyltransferase|nr:ATP phosphoribosyltransferase [Bacteroidales bacterium]